MSDDDEVHLHVTYASHFDMDAAFCARMHKAIFAGLENPPIGFVNQEAQIRRSRASPAASLVLAG
jgi:hypothetical protein